MTYLKRDEIEAAWSIIGASPAGKNARQLLVDELSSICPKPHDPNAVHEGRRILARELLSLFDKEAIDRDAPDDPSPALRQPVPLGPGRRIQRRVEPEFDGEYERAQRSHSA